MNSARRDEIVVALSGDQAQAAAAENLYSLFRSMSALPGSETVETPEICYHRAFPTNPMFHAIWRPRLDQSSADRVIETALQWHQDRITPLVFWINDGNTTPADLGTRVLARGFIPFELDAPCMTVELAELDATLLNSVPENFRIDHVRDAAGVQAFNRCFVETYGLPAWAGQSWEDATLAVGPEESPWQMYVGWRDDRPVAVNMVHLGAGVAGLYAV